MAQRSSSAQAQLLQPADAEAAYLEARATDVAALETHIADLSSLFGRLAGMVAQQGEAVARIEDNAATAQAQLMAAERTLRGAWERGAAGAAGAIALRVTGVLVLAVILLIVFGT